MGSYYSAQLCDKLNDIAASIAANGTEMLLTEFPACLAFLDGDLHAHAIVHVNFGCTAAQTMAAINMTFGMAGWVALYTRACCRSLRTSRALNVAKYLTNRTTVTLDTRGIETPPKS